MAAVFRMLAVALLGMLGVAVLGMLRRAVLPMLHSIPGVFILFDLSKMSGVLRFCLIQPSKSSVLTISHIHIRAHTHAYTNTHTHTRDTPVILR